MVEKQHVISLHKTTVSIWSIIHRPLIASNYQQRHISVDENNGSCISQWRVTMVTFLLQVLRR